MTEQSQTENKPYIFCRLSSKAPQSLEGWRAALVSFFPFSSWRNKK